MMMAEKVGILLLLILTFYGHVVVCETRACDEDSCRRDCHEQTYSWIRLDDRRRCQHLQTGLQCFDDFEDNCGKFPDCMNLKQRMLDETHYFSCIESGNCSTSWIDKCNELPLKARIPDFILPTNDTVLQVCSTHYDFMRCKKVLTTRCPGIIAHPEFHKHNDWELLTKLLCGDKEDIFEYIDQCASIINPSSEGQAAFRQCKELQTATSPPNEIFNPCHGYFTSVDCMSPKIRALCKENHIVEPSIAYFREFQRAKFYLANHGLFCRYRAPVVGSCNVELLMGKCMNVLQEKVARRDSYICSTLEYSESCLKEHEEDCSNHTIYKQADNDVKTYKHTYMCIDDGVCGTDAVRRCTSIVEELQDYTYLLPSQLIVRNVCGAFEEYKNCLVNLSKKCEKVTYHPLFVQLRPWYDKESITCRGFRQAVVEHIDTCASIINNSNSSRFAYSECEKPRHKGNDTRDEDGRSSTSSRHREILLQGEEVCRHFADKMTCYAEEIRNKCPGDEQIIKAAVKWTREYHGMHVYHEHLGLSCPREDDEEKEDKVTVADIDPVSLNDHSTLQPHTESELESTTDAIQSSTVNKAWRPTEITSPPQNQVIEGLGNWANGASGVWASMPLAFSAYILRILAT